jgi:hypothetical protein
LEPTVEPTGFKPVVVQLTFDMTEGVPSVDFRGSAVPAGHIADRRYVPE